MSDDMTSTRAHAFASTMVAMAINGKLTVEQVVELAAKFEAELAAQYEDAALVTQGAEGIELARLRHEYATLCDVVDHAAVDDETRAELERLRAENATYRLMVLNDIDLENSDEGARLRRFEAAFIRWRETGSAEATFALDAAYEEARAAAKPVVHVLQGGWPLCGFSQKVPGEWPPGHLWVRIEEIKDATCKRCLELAAGAKEGWLCHICSQTHTGSTFPDCVTAMHKAIAAAKAESELEHQKELEAIQLMRDEGQKELVAALQAAQAMDAQLKANAMEGLGLIKKEVLRIKVEFEEEQALRERLASLLTKTAAALKGPPPENVFHDWSDLPEVGEMLRRLEEKVLELDSRYGLTTQYPSLREIVSECRAAREARETGR